MKLKRVFAAVDSHTEGEPTRVIIGGIPHIPGNTMLEKNRFFERNLDEIRRLLICEPRGHSAMFGCVVTAPTVPNADAGILFLESRGYLTMCGHGIIGTCTVLLETGVVPAKEPVTELLLDTPAGLVRAQVEVQEGRVKAVSFQNVPSFLFMMDVEVDVPGLGEVVADIAYGGLFYAILPAEMVDLPIEPERAGDIARAGMRVRAALNAQVEVVHPENPLIRGVPNIMFTAPPTNPQATRRNAVVYGEGGIDRSPCGTGTSARIAQLHAKGELRLNEEFIHESIIGSLFHGKLVGETRVGGYPAVIPTIRGRAYITGFNQYVLDPEDPFPFGFLLG